MRKHARVISHCEVCNEASWLEYSERPSTTGVQCEHCGEEGWPIEGQPPPSLQSATTMSTVPVNNIIKTWKMFMFIWKQDLSPDFPNPSKTSVSLDYASSSFREPDLGPVQATLSPKGFSHQFWIGDHSTRIATPRFLPDLDNEGQRRLRSPLSFVRRTETAASTFNITFRKSHVLIPVANSLKFMSASLFSSRSRNILSASTGVWRPQGQGVRAANNSLNCSMLMRYCSKYGRLWSRWGAAV